MHLGAKSERPQIDGANDVVAPIGGGNDHDGH